VSSTDINGQTTSLTYSFDSNSASNGKYSTSVSEPGETGSYTTQSNSYSQCSSSSTLPCFEIDSVTSQYSSAITRTFYDSLGREVETRTPGPGNYDTIVYTLYNDQNHSVLTSVPFQVASGSSWIDPVGAKDYNGNTPGGTAVYYDALGRPLAYQDPSYGGSQEPGVACSSYLGSANTYTGCTNYLLAHPKGDTTTYEAVQSVDANSHSVANFNDALGRTRYTQWYNGASSGSNGLPANSSANEQETVQYNALNEPTSVVETDLAPQTNQTITSVTTTASYDSMGRITQLVDPDRGTHSYTYDADSHLIEDVSGSRTLGYSYDLLGRLGCIQDEAPTLNASGACTTGSNPFVINTYDADPSGVSWGSTNYAKGRLTQSFAITYYPAPDDTQGKVTENMQYDTRGRLITERMQLTATGGTLTFPSFPTYQMALSYNDANQLVTTTTSSTNPSGLGYTTTNVYDSSGHLSGLSNNTTQTADLATLNYDTHAQVSQINFLASNGTSPLASEQFGYDPNLRLLTTSASWQSGSGTSGTIYSQTRTLDPVGNVIDIATTQAAVPGTNNSGGSANEVFCYDGQNRLVWAGNSGTPQGTGSGTCGSNPSNSLNGGASYSNTYTYTHLGQLWQGPYNGAGSYQYLYCNSSQPHQLTGLYPTGTTCSTIAGKTQTYGASYDSWGNMTTRIASGSGGTTATLSYDGQDHLVRWNDNNTTTNEEWYMYDASGQRVLRRSQTGTGNSNTRYTITAFGLEDHIYNGAGTNLNNKYYYSLAGRLIGVNTGSTNYLLTDALGTVVSSISNTLNSASVQGNQLYGPYGFSLYSKGTMGTTKGYTGQYNDSLTQLDYYNARYYDPLVGVFLTADKDQGNLKGMDPYTYTEGNPETWNDPTGNNDAPPSGTPSFINKVLLENVLRGALALSALAELIKSWNIDNDAIKIARTLDIVGALTGLPVPDDENLWTKLAGETPSVNEPPLVSMLFDAINAALAVLDLSDNINDIVRVVGDASIIIASLIDFVMQWGSIIDEGLADFASFLNGFGFILLVGDDIGRAIARGGQPSGGGGESRHHSGGGLPPLPPPPPLPSSNPNTDTGGTPTVQKPALPELPPIDLEEPIEISDVWVVPPSISIGGPITTIPGPIVPPITILPRPIGILPGPVGIAPGPFGFTPDGHGYALP